MARATRSLPWTLVGAAGVIGAYWLIVRTLIVARVGDASLPFIAHGLSGAVTGALMVACAPLRPRREPAAAGALAVAVMSILFLAAPHPAFSWVAARAAHPWGAALGLAALSGACAFAGAWATRRATTATPGATALAALSGLVVTGALIVLGHAVVGFAALSLRNTVVVAWPAATLLAGFATQAVTPVSRPGTCAAGSFVLVAWAVLERASFGGARLLVHGVVTALVGLPIAYLGARLAWRWFGDRDAARAPVAIPAARAR